MNRVVSFDGTSSGSAALSRRSAVLRLGSGGLAALLASSVIPAVAQEASPMAGTPAAGQAYLAIRQYQLAPGHTMEELVATVGSGLVPILQQVPGFREHFLVETSEGVLSISVFADQAGAEESTAAGGRLGAAEPGRFLHRAADGDDGELSGGMTSAGQCPARRRRSGHRARRGRSDNPSAKADRRGAGRARQSRPAF